MLIAVNYHYIRPAFEFPYPGVNGITPNQFAKQLQLLMKTGIFIGAKEIFEAVVNSKKLPDNSIVITFDDGLSEQFDYALPILQKLKIPAIFFINTAPISNRKVALVHKLHLLLANVEPKLLLSIVKKQAVEFGIKPKLKVEDKNVREIYCYDTKETGRLKYFLNFSLDPSARRLLIDSVFFKFFEEEAKISENLYMNVEQIKTLASLGYLGNHTHKHEPLGLIPIESAVQDIKLSQNTIKEWIGFTPFALSYPYGSIEACSRQVANAAENSGIKFAFTMERAGNMDFKSPMHLARIDCNDAPGGKSQLWNTSNLFSSMPSSRWYRKDFNAQ